MSLTRRIARPLLAAPFIFEGVRTAMRPDREIAVAPGAFKQLDRTLERSSSIPDAVDSRMLVRTAAAVSAGAGLLYATNRAPRLSAAVLLMTTGIGLANRKKIWELKGEERMQEVQSILTDAGLLGGIMLAVVDHEGRPSLRYRTDKLIERGQKRAAKKQRQIERAARVARKEAGKAIDGVTSEVQKRLA